jgi:hypothetical protein
MRELSLSTRSTLIDVGSATGTELAEAFVR